MKREFSVTGASETSNELLVFGCPATAWTSLMPTGSESEPAAAMRSRKFGSSHEKAFNLSFRSDARSQ